MKIYTRHGDAGETSLWAGARVPKDDPRVEAIGAIDECNAAIGLVLAEGVMSPLGNSSRCPSRPIHDR